MSDKHAPTRATFTPQPPKGKSSIDVHFNPVSLQYSVTNTLKAADNGKSKKQYVTQGTGKLTMDLVFDNTADGQDVRVTTQKIARLMEPAQKSSDGKKDVPAVVRFDWGSYSFQGMVESYKETLDFFSSTGVPLRASVNLTLAEQDKIFSPGSTVTSGDSADVVDVPPAPGTDVTSAATRGGNPGAGRGLATVNNLESMRFPSGPISVSDSISLGPPVAFASGGVGLSMGAGAGIGIGGGVGIGAGAGIAAGIGASGGIGAGISGGLGVSGGAAIGISGGASGAGSGITAGVSGAVASAPLFGSSASAGISASEGAFAGLRVTTQKTTYALDTTSFSRTSQSVTLATDNDAGCGLGGRVTVQASAGLSADVGASTSLRSRISFEES
jgi:contractile injection system tube protein